ncbi:tetratricopeptide repeat protein [Candidatus Pelagibacter sp.]|jgi:tetratricopeptide (TPR) repeat protein|nr:tetratricopeptide repeat protein [Candidatus Pelagibacter sp.]|tara:strand:+ start:1275 stop:2960 length:1686 start_codon:yes stop_codon:yes gene_type:complete
MLVKFLKFILILLIYQSPLYSKNNTLNDFNSRFLSNYFSGIVAYENSDNSQALKFFNSSKFLIKQHEIYLEKYTFALVLNGKVKKAINQIKQNSTKDNSNFFQANLLLAIDSLKKGDYKSSEQYINRSYELINNDRFSLIIAEIFKEYLYVFNEKKIPKSKKKFGNFSYINEVFQRCYLGDQSTKTYFKRLINSQNDADYSRYAFFFVNYLIESEKYDEAKQITDDFDYLNSSLLISQGKKWIEDTKFKNFLDIFSCTNSSDIMGEFFFLVANLYSSQGDYEKSNFYLNISNYLNPKFTLNLSLLAENYYTNEDYENTKKTLEVFDKTNEFYYWFKIKKEAQIISNNLDKDVSLKFINSKFKGIKNPNKKMIFDIANFNKNAKKYAKAINYYDQILLNIDSNSDLYAEILYRRGGSYERSGDYKNADNDLLKSLEINPDDAYVLNYLAYSWLEREYKIDTALEMLENAYASRSNDPYIIDSIGWAYFLVGQYEKAENFLKRAVELMPQDPIVNDHYGDILWKLNRKIQARYFWQYVLKLEETEDEMKKNIKEKLIDGIKQS